MTPDESLSGLKPISSSIIQGRGIGFILWIIVESDLHPLSHINVMFKYADDTNLLVPENTDVTLDVEFSHIRTWADSNGLLNLINLAKMKELNTDTALCSR